MLAITMMMIMMKMMASVFLDSVLDARIVWNMCDRTLALARAVRLSVL